MSKKVADDAELKSFCNRVRAAGGGKEIADLLPSIPADGSSCLIANNLNFGCEVSSAFNPPDSNPDAWSMRVGTEELAEKIAKAMKLKFNRREIFLPKRIYRVAELYDYTADLFTPGDETVEAVARYSPKRGHFYKYALIEDRLTKRDKELVKRFWPVIKAQVKKDWVKPSFV